MHKSLQDPWTEENNRLTRKWIKDALDDRIVPQHQDLTVDSLIAIVEHAENLNNLEELTTVEAGILLSLWAGRAAEALKDGGSIKEKKNECPF
jgi:hypothetical protein